MENYGPWEGNLVKAQKQVLLCGSIQISKWGGAARVEYSIGYFGHFSIQVSNSA